MNVIAGDSVSVIVSVTVNVRPGREREHERETQRANNGMASNVIPTNQIVNSNENCN